MWLANLRWTHTALFLAAFAAVIPIFLVFGELLHLLSFVVSGNPAPNSVGAAMDFAWILRFWGVAVILYGLSALLLLLAHLPARQDPSKLWAHLLLIVILILVIVAPVYALGVYGTVPQQIGGGEVMPVQIVTSDSHLRETLSAHWLHVYFVDRTSRGSVFLLLIDGRTHATQIMEVNGSNIQGIIYAR